MRKKILYIIIAAIVLILPSVIAITSYTAAQNNPVTEFSVSQLELKTPDGEKHLIKKSDNALKAVFGTFFDMNETDSQVDTLPDDISAYQCFEATYQCYNKTLVYKYYFSSDPNNAYLYDFSGDYYKITKDAASEFMSTQYAVSLFPHSSLPILSVGQTPVVAPSNINWKYIDHNGVFVDAQPVVSDSTPSCDVSGGLQLSFDNEPDQIFVTITDKDENKIFEDTYDKIDPALFADNIVYNVKVNAKWYQSEDKLNYGEANYSFIANVLSPAAFYLNTTNIQYGDFVVISAKNIVNPSQIKFKSEPEIDFTPVFVEEGGFYHAIIPFSLDLISKNSSAERYSLTLTYGDASQELLVDVSVRKSTVAHHNISLDKITNLRNETTLADFDSVMKDIFANVEQDIYWMKDNMLITPVDGAVKHGFGIKIVLSANNTSYIHEGVNYNVSANEAVQACLPGKVIFVGQTTLSGTTVVVDHGAGLKSLYAHMNSTSVKVGDVVGKGQMLGIVGNTGFCSGRTLHFGLYVQDVPVRYYSYETNGVCVSEAVAKIMGLNQAKN